MAPNADEALLDGIEASPDGGAAMAEAHLLGLSDDEREDLIERAGNRDRPPTPRSGVRRCSPPSDAGRLPVEVTPEMVAVAAITELGD